MIASQDRSGWFGASDTAKMMGNWETATFWRWWLEKMGIARSSISTKAMMAGAHYEHRILDALGVAERDRQIRIRGLRLRVNLDGEDDDTITEVKTHSKPFVVTKAYWQQAQVEMFAAGKWLRIAAYRMGEAEYGNYFLPIDRGRITTHPISYDAAFIKNEYLPRLTYLAYCLKRRRPPCSKEFLKDARAWGRCNI